LHPFRHVAFLQDSAKEEIRALPGQYRWGVDRLVEGFTDLVAAGLKTVLVFGVVSVGPGFA
jgi:delta-aminolevulinic acid dehydratase/porphobilinogen synthase